MTRLVILAAAALSVGALVAGCGLIPRDYYSAAVRLDGESVELAICGDLLITELTMDQRNLAAGEDWTIFFQHADGIQYHRGEVLDTASFPTSSIGGPWNDSGDQLRVFASEDRELLVNSLFYVGDAGVPTDGWLQKDGAVTEAPCTDH